MRCVRDRRKPTLVARPPGALPPSAGVYRVSQVFLACALTSELSVLCCLISILLVRLLHRAANWVASLLPLSASSPLLLVVVAALVFVLDPHTAHSATHWHTRSVAPTSGVFMDHALMHHLE